MPERIVFDRSLYAPEAVEAAATAYKDHAQVEVTLDGDAIVAVISTPDADDTRAIANAFGNHVLHETIAQRREAAVREVG